MRVSFKTTVAMAAVMVAMSASLYAAKADSDDPAGGATQSAVRDARDSIYSREQTESTQILPREKTVVSHTRHKRKPDGSPDRTITR